MLAILTAPAVLLKAQVTVTADAVSNTAPVEKIYSLDAIVVRTDAEPAISQSRISREQVRFIPGVANDPLRAMQKLPGVVSPSDFSGQLAVRGGGPQDNLYYINDIPWPIPFHFGGLLSTVGGDALDRVDLYAAAFPARWGGVDGAIMDAVTRRDLGSQWGGRLDLNLLLTDGFIEGPLGPGGFSAWGRRSYFDLIAPSAAGDAFTALPYFWDAGGTYQVDFGAHRLRAFVNSTEDVLAITIKPDDTNQDEQAGELKFRNRYTTVGANWIWKITDSLESRLTPYWYTFNIEASFGTGFRFDLLPRVSGLRWDVEWEAGKNQQVKMGAETKWNEVGVYGILPRRSEGQGSGQTVVSDPQALTVNTQTRENSVYVQDTITIGNWEWEPGLRLEAPQLSDQVNFSPRMRLRWEYQPDRRLYTAWGQYFQPPANQQTNDIFGNPNLLSNLTDHYVVGWESRLVPQVLARVEAYYKNYRQRVVPVSDTRLYANEGEGLAKGLELLIKYDEGDRFFGWLSWSWSRSERSNLYGPGWALYQYDQPHVITLLGSWAVTSSFRLGATASYHSGTLITPVTGRVYNPTQDRWFPLYGDAYSERLGDYLRVDVRADYTWTFESWAIGLYTEILNLTRSTNPLAYTYSKDFSSKETVGQLPFLPYAGVRVSF